MYLLTTKHSFELKVKEIIVIKNISRTRSTQECNPLYADTREVKSLYSIIILYTQYSFSNNLMVLRLFTLGITYYV